MPPAVKPQRFPPPRLEGKAEAWVQALGPLIIGKTSNLDSVQACRFETPVERPANGLGAVAAVLMLRENLETDGGVAVVCVFGGGRPEGHATNRGGGLCGGGREGVRQEADDDAEEAALTVQGETVLAVFLGRGLQECQLGVGVDFRVGPEGVQDGEVEVFHGTIEETFGAERGGHGEGGIVGWEL